jgi:DNA-binding protein
MSLDIFIQKKNTQRIIGEYMELKDQTEQNNSAMPENVIYVGKKQAMNYVLAVVTQFNSGARSITIKARGNTIGRAVDVAEIARNKFIPDLKSPKVSISSEELTNEDGSKSKVSAIHILLEK